MPSNPTAPNGSGQTEQLRQRQRHVAGAGGQVDDQVVEFSPARVLEELRDGSVEHGTAPHDRFVRRDEQPHRHHLESIDDRRFDAANRLAVASRFVHDFRPRVQTEHVRDAGTIHVRIHQTDSGSVQVQAVRQRSGHGALADASLAAADGNDILHPQTDRPARVLAALTENLYVKMICDNLAMEKILRLM